MNEKAALNDELRSLHLLAPVSQAALLVKVAQEARVLHLSLGDSRREPMVARDLESALEGAMDAAPGAEADDAAGHLVDVLRRTRALGLQIRAEISDVEIDGALGLARLPLLSAVLSDVQSHARVAQAA
ncbi:MAG: hypothetical protein ING59_04130 [Burkholderiales bacterium]|jgi:hypothetical protein|nr:hypothetical protein [Burkholderiales bacterium]